MATLICKSTPPLGSGGSAKLSRVRDYLSKHLVVVAIFGSLGKQETLNGDPDSTFL